MAKQTMQAEIEEGRAKFALEAVKKVRDDKISDKAKKEYKSYCRRFAGMVLTNGLASSIAFLKAKSESYDYLYKDIEDWLKKEKEYFSDPTTLEDYVCNLDSDHYRAVTNEVLALYKWLGRFATGLIKGELDER